MTLISTAGLPEVRIDPAALADAAAGLKARVSGVATAGHLVAHWWGKLPKSYDAPEASELLAKMSPVKEAASDFGTTLARVSEIMTILAENLSVAKTRLEALRFDIEQHRAAVLNWRSMSDETDGSLDSQWGMGQQFHNSELIAEREAVASIIDQALEEARNDLAAIGDVPFSVSGLAAGGAPTTAALGWSARQGEFTTNLALAFLTQLDRDDADAVRAMLERHPEWEDLLRQYPPDTDAVSQWWSGLDPTAMSALIAGAPVIIGALGGVPPLARVDANKLNAQRRLDEINAEIARIEREGYGTDDNTPYAWESSVADYITSLRELREEAEYLQRAANGDVQLYLYEPDHDRIIEMIGNPDTATRTLSFVPGTNATMENFYGDPDTAITSFARWQVENAGRGDPTVAFVFKDGTFPQLDDLAGNGPQYNTTAARLGHNYHQFLSGIETTIPATAMISSEHSFGTSIAGAAEMENARAGREPQIDTRILVAGIGMTNAWEPQSGTDYYAYQAPDDINRSLTGVELGPLGFGTSPTEGNGITELDTGIQAPSPWLRSLNVLNPFNAPIIEGIYLESRVDNHNQIVSANPTENNTVLDGVRQHIKDAVPR